MIWDGAALFIQRGRGTPVNVRKGFELFCNRLKVGNSLAVFTGGKQIYDPTEHRSTPD